MEGFPVMQFVEYCVPPAATHHGLPLPPRARPRGCGKYVLLCVVCGGLSVLLGALFLAVYLILRTYTSSLDYFHTLPTYIPAAMLLITGVAVMCLARRRNRYTLLIKLCGLCCLACAGTCVVVTVTTTVVHMSRLQSLRECVYTAKTRTCTCYSVLLDSTNQQTDEGSRYVFNSTPDCEVIHGALYSCLRALFGLSVIGILVSIFCSMLVYQLLCHERKKMYWEELELRCRYLYTQRRAQPRSLVNLPATPQPTQHCACCQQSRYQDVLSWQQQDARVGNLYSPNPVSDDTTTTVPGSRGFAGWSWPRLPWSRQSPATQQTQLSIQQRDSGNIYHRAVNCSSPDSQYGFNSGQATSGAGGYTMIEPGATAWGPPPPYSNPNSPLRCPVPADNYVNTTHSAGDEGPMLHDTDSCRTLRPQPRRKGSTATVVKNKTPHDRNTKVCKAYKREITACEARKNLPRGRVQDLTESEVYFADVSSCCNVSVRNEPLSMYEEAIDPNRRNERSGLQNRVCNLPYHHGMLRHHHHGRQVLSRPTQHIACLQKVPKTECQPAANFQRIPSSNECSYSDTALDGSEEDDLELVSFSRQKQSSIRNRVLTFRPEVMHDPADSSHELSPKSNFPSPMSISSPSTAGKETGGFPEVDNNSADSVWSCYTQEDPPDSHYETIPEQITEDLNGNSDCACDGNETGMKVPSPTQRKLYLNESFDQSAVWRAGNDLNDEGINYQSPNNINSPKAMDRTGMAKLKRDFPKNDRAQISNDFNSPKPMRRRDITQFQNSFSTRRHNMLCSVNREMMGEHVNSPNKICVQEERLSDQNSFDTNDVIPYKSEAYECVSGNSEVSNSNTCCDINKLPSLQHIGTNTNCYVASDFCLPTTQCGHEEDCGCYVDLGGNVKTLNRQCEIHSVEV